MLVTLTAGCLILALASGRPHHLQQQVFYPVQQAPGSVYYVPQADAASVTSVQQYAAPVPLPVGVGMGVAPQYVLLYPGGPQHNFLPGRADGETTPRPTIWNLFNVFLRPTTTPKVEEAETEAATAPTPTRGVVTSTTVATTVEETTPKPANVTPVKPEKIVGEGEMILAVEQARPGMTDEQKAPLEELDESFQPSGSPSSDGRQFVLVQRPQFFGNYDLLHQGDAPQQFGAPPPAVSNFLLFRNGFVQPAPGGRPLKLEEDAKPEPGVAALAFQEELRRRDSTQTRGARPPGSQHVDLSHLVGDPFSLGLPLVHVGPAHQSLFVIGQKVPGQGVVVDADRPKKEGPGAEETEQAGPSVAQAKPQAIALAGIGGMAAAAPVATAVVGPGGLAVAAPSATAVAGPSGGGGLVGPAQAAIAAVNKHLNKVNQVKLKSNPPSQDYRDDDRYHK